MQPLSKTKTPPNKQLNNSEQDQTCLGWDFWSIKDSICNFVPVLTSLYCQQVNGLQHNIKKPLLTCLQQPFLWKGIGTFFQGKFLASLTSPTAVLVTTITNHKNVAPLRLKYLHNHTWSVVWGHLSGKNAKHSLI